ncbi:hypothetical protein ACQKGQ_28915, partial [Bacillus cereus]
MTTAWAMPKRGAAVAEAEASSNVRIEKKPLWPSEIVEENIVLGYIIFILIINQLLHIRLIFCIQLCIVAQ